MTATNTVLVDIRDEQDKIPNTIKAAKQMPTGVLLVCRAKGGCGATKDETEFSLSAGTGKRLTKCRKCRSTAATKWCKDNPKRKQYQKDYRERKKKLRAGELTPTVTAKVDEETRVVLQAVPFTSTSGENVPNIPDELKGNDALTRLYIAFNENINEFFGG